MAGRVGQGRRTRRTLIQTSAALAAVTGGGLALSACGAANTPQAGTSDGDPAKSLPPATVRFHHRGGTPPGQEPTLYQEQIPAFQAKYPTIKIEDEGFTGEDYYTKITVMGAGGTLGDVMWTSIGGGGVYNVAAQKLITPVDPFVAKDKFDLGQYYKGCVDALRREGKLYGLPFKSHPGVSILFFNQTLFERAGAGVPDKNWTTDRLLDAAKRLTQGDTWGYFPATNQKTVLTMTRAWGGELLDPEGKRSLLNSPQAIAAVTWMYEAFNRHNVAPRPSVASDQGGVDRLFTNGKLASGKWGTSFQNTANRDVKDAFTWFASLHPKGPGGVGGSDYEVDGDSLITTSKVQEQGWQWVKWLTNQESGIRLGEIGGTVGGRPDVYRSERLLKDPVRRVFLEAMESAQATRPVFNTRMAEYEKTIEDGLRPVWEGQATPTKAFMDELTRQVQAVLDKPLP